MIQSRIICLRSRSEKQNGRPIPEFRAGSAAASAADALQERDVRSDPARFAQLRGEAEEHLGRDARTDGEEEKGVGRWCGPDEEGLLPVETGRHEARQQRQSAGKNGFTEYVLWRQRRKQSVPGQFRRQPVCAGWNQRQNARPEAHSPRQTRRKR